MTSERSHLARATKIAVILSTLASVLFQALHTGRDRWFLPWVALSALLAGFAAGRSSSRRTVGAVVAAGYLTPVFLLAIGIGFRYWYLSIWMSAFIGVLAGSATTITRWHGPARLRFPLVAWALAVAFTWPIVALRVLDWNPSLLWRPPFTLSDAVHAVEPAVWVAHVASVHLLGLLWMDWLWGEFGADTSEGAGRFERAVILPLLAAAVIGAVFASYQGFVNLDFLSIGVWAQFGRATGPLADGNASGALSALWIAVALVLAVRARTWRATIVLALGAAVLVAATYASSSRTAALCALVSLGAAVHIVATERAYRRQLIVAAVIVVVLGAVSSTYLSSSVRGPITRIAEVLPGVSKAHFVSAAQQLWDRQGYGTAGVLMIAAWPVQGVGVGAFHLLGPDFFQSVAHVRIPADNAQNWFRHQLAELGVVGSIGWIWWCVMLTAALFATPRSAELRLGSIAARYTIAGFGLASLLGMPSQNPIVALTVWTLAFWLLLSTSRGDQARAPSDERTWPHAVALGLALLLAVVTVAVGLDGLRPPALARRFGYLYQYGVYDSMNAPQGTTQTSAHAVAVMAAASTHFQLTTSVAHPDADRQPVEVSVWIDGERVVHSRFQKDVPLVKTITVPGGNRRFVLETRVDRTFASQDPPRPEVGLNLSWKFVE